MSHAITTTANDAHRMAYAGYMDGHGSEWNNAYAKAHGEASREIYAALKEGRAAAVKDDAEETAK